MLLSDKFRKKFREYLISPEWANKQQEFRRWCERRNIPWECVGCGNKKVYVHHRTYVRLGEEDMRDLIPLCRKCDCDVREINSQKKIPLARTDLALREVRRWTEEEMVRRMSPFGKIRKAKDIRQDTEGLKKEFLSTEIVRARNPPMPLVKNHDKVRAMARNGYTISQIAKAFKVSYRQAYIYLNGWG